MTLFRTPPKSSAATADQFRRAPAPGGATALRGSVSLARCGMLAVLALGMSGCASDLLDKKVSINNIFGSAGRKALDAVEISQRDPSEPPPGSEELEAAKSLFDKEDYSAAKSAYKKIAKKYKDLPAREEALFMIAECDFKRQYFPSAQDEYDELLNEGSPRYSEQSAQRLMAIARYWLNSPKPPSEVELAHFERNQPGSSLEEVPDAQIPFSFPLTPNLFDRSRPLFDTHGRAIQALRSIWTKDSTGPLADDALLLAGTYHMRRGDYESADHSFATIREMYNNREHAQAAYLLGQHASYQSYQGPRYDGKQLAAARDLTESALSMYPDSPQAKKLKADREKMRMEAARRDWTRVQYYMKRSGEKDSAAVCAEFLLLQHPDSPQADEARKLLLELGPDYYQGVLPTSLFKAPSSPAEDYDSSDDVPPAEDNEPPGRVVISDDAEPLPRR